MADEIAALLALRDSDAGQSKVPSFFCGVRASVPSLHCRSRQIFMTDSGRDMFRARSERKFLADFSNPISKACMGRALRLRAIPNCAVLLARRYPLQPQRLQTLGVARFVHSLMDALEQPDRSDRARVNAFGSGRTHLRLPDPNA